MLGQVERLKPPDTHNKPSAFCLLPFAIHASDFEAGIAALDDSVRFSAVLNRLRTNTDPNTFGVPQTVLSNTITLSPGDNSIPGPFLFA